MISIAKELTLRGYEVYTPLSENSTCDLIVLKDGLIERVECKATDAEGSAVSWMVSLRQIRPNRTTNVIKKFDSSKSEILGIYIVKEDRVVILSSKDYEGRSALTIKKLGYANPIGDGATLEK